MESLTQIEIETIRNAVKESFSQEESADSMDFHPAEDVMFLESFLAGNVSEDSLSQYRNHLANCSQCRQAMALYAKNGLLESIQTNESARTETRISDRRRALRLWTTIAVSAMIVVTVYFLIPIQTNKPDINIVKIPSEKKTSVKTLALAELKQTLTPEDMPEDYAITSLGFLPNGLRPSKDFPLGNPRFTTIEQAFDKAIAENPDNVQIQLDFAAFLLFQKQDSKRAEQMITEIQSDSTQYYRLKGVIAFLRNDFHSAAEFFTLVWEREAKNPVYGDCVNLAATLYQQGNYSQAKTLYEQAGGLTQNPRQKLILEKLVKHISQGIVE